MRKTVSEIFDDAEKIEDKDAKIEHLRKHWHPALANFLTLVFAKNIKWHLPNGLPPIQFSNTQGSNTRLYYEIGKLYRFYDSETVKAPNINKYQREKLFIEVLEELTENDAKLLCAVKDKKWPYKTLTKKLFEEAYPGVPI